MILDSNDMIEIQKEEHNVNFAQIMEAKAKEAKNIVNKRRTNQIFQKPE